MYIYSDKNVHMPEMRTRTNELFNLNVISYPEYSTTKFHVYISFSWLMWHLRQTFLVFRLLSCQCPGIGLFKECRQHHRSHRFRFLICWFSTELSLLLFLMCWTLLLVRMIGLSRCSSFVLCKRLLWTGMLRSSWARLRVSCSNPPMPLLFTHSKCKWLPF